MNDSQNRVPPDRRRVIVAEPWEAERWSAEFGVTQNELKRAVAMVGVLAANVGRYLDGQKKPMN